MLGGGTAAWPAKGAGMHAVDPAVLAVAIACPVGLGLTMWVLTRRRGENTDQKQTTADPDSPRTEEVPDSGD